LADAPAAAAQVDRYGYRATSGTQDMAWGGCPWSGTPADQRPDEIQGLVFTTPQLDERLHVLGDPLPVPPVSSPAPVAHPVGRLAEVAPDGTSALVTAGALNLTHRSAHERLRLLVWAEVYEVTVELDATGYVFEVGHRIRLAVSSSDWPNTW